MGADTSSSCLAALICLPGGVVVNLAKSTTVGPGFEPPHDGEFFVRIRRASSSTAVHVKKDTARKPLSVSGHNSMNVDERTEAEPHAR